jgi:hypothetical protein
MLRCGGLHGGVTPRPLRAQKRRNAVPHKCARWQRLRWLLRASSAQSA